MDVLSMKLKNSNITLYCFIIGLFLMTMNLYAADIMITIKERGTGVLISGAYVVINDEQYVERSDENGLVNFPTLEINDKIKIVAAEYDDLVVTIKNTDKEFTFYLYPEMVEGDGLEVTEQRILEKVSKISLSKEELITAPGSGGDPLKVLSSLPGIVETSGSSAKIYMRGSEQTDNNVFVNRSPISYLYHMGGYHSTINPALIEDINVFLGGFPVEYGDALGGVIDVKLRAPRTDRQHYIIDISTIAASVVAEGPVGKNSENGYYFALRQSYIDKIIAPETFSSRNEDDDKLRKIPSYYDGQFTYHHKLDKGFIETYVFTAKDAFKFEIIGSAKSDPDLAGLVTSEEQYVTTGINYTTHLTQNSELFLPISYSSRRRDQTFGQDSNKKQYFVNSDVRELRVQPDILWRLNKGNNINYGIEVKYQKIPVDAYISRGASPDEPDFNFTSQQKYTINTTLNYDSYAPYIKYRKNWSKSWVTILGLRYSDINMKGGYNSKEVSPRGTVEYHLSKDTILNATWGRYIQAPKGVEVLNETGNPNLKVREAEHRILGVEHQFTPLYSIKTEVYQKLFTDLITIIDGNSPPDNYSNEGTGLAYGIDIFLKRRAHNRQLGWLSLSLSKSERTNQRTSDTYLFSGDTPLIMTGVWRQPFSGSWNKWDWGIKIQVKSGNLYTPVTGRHQGTLSGKTVWIPEYASINSARYPTNFKVDARFTRTKLFKTTTLKYYIEIHNITFSENIEGYDYGYEYEKIGNPTKVTGGTLAPFFGFELNF